MKIKIGDRVQVTSGKDKGKTGKVDKVFPKKDSVIVSRINIYKKHLKPQGEGKPGGIVDITKPLSVAKITLVCPKCNKPTRVGYLLDKNNKKIRICKKCNQVISK